MEKITSNCYVKLLESWAKAASKYFYAPPGNSEIMCYGTGESYGWSVQTNMNAFAALAVLATSADLCEENTGMNRDELLNIALKILRYSLHTHIGGEFFCSDNKQWGHSWISVLALERMMHGFEAIKEFLSEDDKLEMRKILESESNNLLDNYTIVAGIDPYENKPESNIWNGSMLLRTAAYYPDTPRKNEYQEKATVFFINGISIPSDKLLTEIFNKKMVKEWHIGANFTENFSLNHHRYMNVGYMVICLSNIAMLHFSLKERGLAVPEEVYFHARDLWNAIKQFLFSDGRLLRIGGDTRARYCYCQDYAVPMWLFVLDQYGDEKALQCEIGWLRQVMKEKNGNADGAFLSARLETIALQSPFYYTRLEGDRAVAMSYGAYWRRQFEKLPQRTSLPLEEPRLVWQDEFHGATLVRDSNRIASWVWVAGQGPTGICVNPDKSNMAEWQNNLCGELEPSNPVFPTVIANEHELFDNGFLNYGWMHWTERYPLGEGEDEVVFAKHAVVFAALPDEKTVVCLQYAEATRRIYLQRIKGLGLKIPNDLFNGFKRKYFAADKNIELHGCPGKEEIIKFMSPWLNIDDCFSVFTIYGDKYFTIYRPSERQIRVKNPSVLKSLYADEICSEFRMERQFESQGKNLIDTGVVLMTGITASATESAAKQQRWQAINTDIPGCKAVRITDANDREYLLIANFSEKNNRMDLSAFLPANTPAGGKKAVHGNKLSFKPFSARIFNFSS